MTSHPLERLSFILTIVGLFVISTSQWYYLMRMLGLDLTAIRPDRYFTDTAMLLMLDWFVTVSHLMLDIRWHAIVHIGVVAVLPSAGLLLFVGSPGGAAAPTLLFCLAAMVGSLRSFHYGWTHCCINTQRFSHSKLKC